MKPIKLVVAAVLTSVALGTTAVHAADTEGRDGRRMQRMHGPSLERMVFGNALAAELAKQTGRTADEVRELFADGGPREAAETLGLDRDAMKAAMEQARQAVIAQALAAQMITAEQAQTLAEAKPRHLGKKGPRPDAGTGEDG
ncbi:hypothetical protein [Sinimarinibacterium flocculans]|uniref:hypothetical protein n=1 Tax=Sinimarinibacterium flocculans TaxID=985250 RepID=UPI0024935CAD|nr:hypothetical protein [Sinimarinibacterium flocculans]